MSLDLHKLSTDRRPETVIHNDIVYAADSSIQVVKLPVWRANGRQQELILDGEYRI